MIRKEIVTSCNMSKERSDSAVEMEMWGVDDSDHGMMRHVNHPDDDDDMADDVFEVSMVAENHDDGKERGYQRTAPIPAPQRNMNVLSGPRGKRVSEDNQRGQVSPHRRPVYDSWSVSGRQYTGYGNTSIITRLHPSFCINDAPEPAHPPTPPTTPTLVLTNLASSPTPATEDSGGMVTLHSLGYGHDSGYIPSPSSANSFTFSSDEDEPRPKVATAPQKGVTPPIAIPHARRRPAHHLANKEQRHQDETKHEVPPKEDWTPVQRGRTRSCPDQMRPPVLPRAPVPRFPLTLTPKPNHGRNWSTPATTPDGQPLLTPTSPEARSSTSRASRDAIIDLTEEDGGVNGGHRRRVLVLALPDLIIDTEGRASGACTPPSSTPSAQSPVGNSESSDSFMGAGGRYVVRSRPAWRKPRALSCDVTMEVEVGQELRRIADTFHTRRVDGEVSVWRRLRNSWRSFSSSLPSPELI
ncbi:uncharacterized protein [Procambarus clarkii]|uniref:uncharacterized protein n=1 Tax=Procambarus clarkii TaxID=6728 RepID=UPI001E670517|nr:uncharacterized protein LOC123754950 [Procambarus clarkii]